jgi:hypothetical protein
MRTGAFGFRAAERLDSGLPLPRLDRFRLLPIEHQTQRRNEASATPRFRREGAELMKLRKTRGIKKHEI